MGKNARMSRKAKVIAGEADIDAAVTRGRYRDATEPLAVTARYDQRIDAVVVKFNNGVVLAVPRRLVQGLQHASPAQLAKIQIQAPGTALWWDALDTGVTTEGLLSGTFGNRRWMASLGSVGGRVTSDAKAAAARANGKKGGRPRKKGVSNR
jgi:hypothetical protein